MDPSRTTRRQLTLFVAPGEAQELERVRAAWNPVQRRLIDAHVTLCREDELIDLPQVRRNLRADLPSPITIDFGPATRFDDGRGVFLPTTGDGATFHALRSAALRGVIAAPRLVEPHLTLVHPRNATCTEATFAAIAARPLPVRLTFSTVSLIEQADGGPWRVLEVFPLGAGPGPTTPA